MDSYRLYVCRISGPKMYHEGTVDLHHLTPPQITTPLMAKEDLVSMLEAALKTAKGETGFKFDLAAMSTLPINQSVNGDKP